MTTGTGQRPQHLKEVDRMENNTWHTTAVAPNFGMPAFGPAFRAAQTAAYGTPAGINQLGTADVCVDVRVKRAHRGSSAWRPPIS
ncbi:hypothetical protein [Nocardioides piscis]|uniref:Uncharacterized protein n=1 Tax=Nocardioides piscis TaxID=2714938 RepID=A0A6G7YFQ7_9ACTN|nr:hypothetical protein [Nocardioides piscis]QIK75652.1 hypothetical protein G7071_09545 [Nocardioides piscis]